MATQEQEDPLAESRERIKAMMIQEAHYAVPDYLAPQWQQKLRDMPDIDGVPSSSSEFDTVAIEDDDRISEDWREKICQWCYEVVDRLDFGREVVAVAMSYLDRYLATQAVDRRAYQLAAMTALYLAIKLYVPGRLRPTALVALSGGCFAPAHLVAMEYRLLRTLRWRVHPPTPAAFCGPLLALVPREVAPRARHDAGELALFLTELAAYDYWYVARKPSAVAAAAVLLALALPGPPHRLAPRHAARFRRRAAEAGVDVAHDPEIHACYERLREVYVAGDYAPNLEKEMGVRIAAVSPTGVADGPAACESTDEERSQMECE